MRYNLMFPMGAVKHYERWIEGGSLGEVARVVEQAGFESISVSEHPYPDDEWLRDGGHHAFDPFVALTAMAATTTRLRLLTAIAVLAYRSPFLTAKAAATLDLVSGGRLTLGVAAGYLKREFEALGADFHRRGRLLDAAIPAMRAVWRGEEPREGPFAVRGHSMAPGPVQPGGPPIWIGGNSRAARRRAVALGDAWMPIPQSVEMAEITRTPPIENVSDLAALVEEVQQQRAEAGKPPLEILFSGFEKPLLRDGDASAFVERVAERVDEYRAAGVTVLQVEPASRSLTTFRDDVAALGSGLPQKDG